MEATTIGELFKQAVQEAYDRKAYTLLVDGESQEVTLTYGELGQRVKQVAARLQRLGLQGERVLLVFPFGLEFNIALLGCVCAGAVAVLTYPPRPDHPLTPLETIAADAEASAVLTTDATYASLRDAIPNYPALQKLSWLSTDRICQEEEAGDWHLPALSGDHPAFLSYTSGSTNTPKGVLLTHANLLDGLEFFCNVYGLPQHCTGVFSNPLYHVGNLVGTGFMTLRQGHSVLIPTQLVLEKPIRWLKAVSKYRAYNSGGFNFLYQLSLQHITPAERDSLDLRSLGVMGSGGERIDSHLLERFAEFFKPAGLQKNAFIAAYGMTETTGVGFCGRGLGHHAFRTDQLQRNQAVLAEDDAQGKLDLVSCGKPVFGKTLIVDPETRMPCEERRIGEIWVQGPHVTVQYWRRPQETEELLRAHLATGEGPFLRTGDLGFLYDNELYITGRLKDIIILRARNYYAPDFEQAASGAHPAMVLGGTAAIGLHVSGAEQLAIVQEVLPGTDPEQYDAIIQAISTRIIEAFEQPVYAIALVEQGALPRTATRKIQRFRCLQDFQSGQLKPIKVGMPGADLEGSSPHASAPTTPLEGALYGIWMGILKRTNIGIHDNFFALGGNSLHAAQVVAYIRDVFQVEFPMQAFFAGPTIALMAKQVEQMRVITDD